MDSIWGFNLCMVNVPCCHAGICPVSFRDMFHLHGEGRERKKNKKAFQNNCLHTPHPQMHHSHATKSVHLHPISHCRVTRTPPE